MTSPPVEPLIVPQLGARPTLCGGKARILLDIYHLVDVPEFVVISSSWFGLAANAQLAEIADCWSRWETAHQMSIQSMRRLAGIQLTDAMRDVLTAQLPEFLPDVSLFAVRSSAAGEDGPRRSFAGLYSTELDVSRADLEQAIVAVWRSWFSVRAITHRDSSFWQPPTMDVVVQRMIDADEAGVVAVYRDSVEVEWVLGTGDRLVDGSVEPARRLVTAPAQNPAGSVEHAAAAAWMLRDQLGVGDLDVEWAADRDRVRAAVVGGCVVPDCGPAVAVVAAAAQLGVEGLQRVRVDLADRAVADRQRVDVLARVPLQGLLAAPPDVGVLQVLLDELTQRGVGRG
ncbi:MAG TPA: PEP/pyruvate-binding domain-containing protein [Actinophytocola sp.]|uniref:PEP/pyruvate-binding domain-containing protein n=1 Tax=Actinophytocola sp. TaxID=1872138 RepID=UPI002DDDABFE|nr:PEP/pyruvate-binding domain-containing protein [Actinophytocola sp.]HEV2782872.1 PEP/pyruvate-binding domain-containing protein [Actinophytocola sp.]